MISPWKSSKSSGIRPKSGHVCWIRTLRRANGPTPLTRSRAPALVLVPSCWRRNVKKPKKPAGQRPPSVTAAAVMISDIKDALGDTLEEVAQVLYEFTSSPPRRAS